MAGGLSHRHQCCQAAAAWGLHGAVGLFYEPQMPLGLEAMLSCTWDHPLTNMEALVVVRIVAAREWNR